MFAWSRRGGGGYGRAFERDPEAVVRDVVLGFVTPTLARTAYGVVVDADGALDVAATEGLRQAVLS